MMGGECSWYGEEKCIQGFWWGDLREIDSLGGVGIGWRILLKWK